MKKRNERKSISIKYIGIKCDSLKLFVYTAQSEQNTFVLLISFRDFLLLLLLFFQHENVCTNTWTNKCFFILRLQLHRFLWPYNASACSHCVTAVQDHLLLLFWNYARKTLRLMITVEVFAQFHKKTTNTSKRRKWRRRGEKSLARREVFIKLKEKRRNPKRSPN